MIGPVVFQPCDHINNHFCPTDCLSGSNGSPYVLATSWGGGDGGLPDAD
jgi:hypothetical protein